MKSPIPSSELIRISSIMTTGLRSGRDWFSILQWISISDPKSEVRDYMKAWIKRLQVDSFEKSLMEERRKSNDLLWSLFIEILLQAHRGASQLSKLFETFSYTGGAILYLRMKQKSLLFIPKFQSWASIIIVFAFTVGLPSLAPGLFPTFITMGRKDLFIFGVTIILMGFGILHWTCSQPQKRLSPKIANSLFCYLLSIYIESGIDLVTAWSRAVQSVEFKPRFKSKLLRPDLNADTIENFLKDLSDQLTDPWPEILTGLRWARHSGSSLSQYLREVSQHETKKILFEWEDEIRKLTMVCLIPLGGMIFPATLFLLIGPQFLELMQIL